MNKVNGVFLASLFTLSACGDGGGSSGTVADGVFKDSNVSGLSYVSGDQSGTTPESGAFRYIVGEDVNFSIGGVDLGSGVGKSIMTPIDLVTGGSLGNTEVINKARFLMMLDADNIPSNGIEISTEVQDIADTWSDVDFSAADFPGDQLDDIRVDASVADGLAHSFPDSATATSHLRSTLLCASAGAFQGTFSGTENGNVVFIVDPVTGEVNGSSYNPDTELSVEINSSEAIDYDAGLSFVSAEVGAKIYNGTVDSADNVSGTWESSTDTSSGTFEVSRLSDDSDATYRYLATFTGGDNGVFAFDVDSNNNVTGTIFSVSQGDEIDLTGTLTDNTRLDVESDNGDEITVFIDPDTSAITSGVWINQDSSGTISSGGGCRLN